MLIRIGATRSMILTMTTLNAMVTSVAFETFTCIGRMGGVESLVPILEGQLAS